MLCVALCEIGLKYCNILLCKNILKYKATLSIRLKGRSTSLNTEENNSSTPIADTSVTEVGTNAQTPFFTANAIVGI